MEATGRPSKISKTRLSRLQPKILHKPLKA